ncbi:MAG: hypothetical protein M0Z75_01730 [Nitrospiraceae bacterium]|nr:hypothetical protein [Nitrospiraceae bacterium]
MTRLKVNSGACGFISSVTVEKEKGKNVSVRIETDCEMVRNLGPEIASLEIMSVAFTNFLNNPVYKAAAKHLRHVACPVPCAVIKAVEVESGFCLPRDVSMTFEK